jgi:ElaB/YqjD/DUF883 family membrane-anchored ribosome-binding protein
MREHIDKGHSETLLADARHLIAATADVAGEQVNQARKRLIAVLEKPRNASKRPTRSFTIILTRLLPSPRAWELF